jgi:nucleoid-associated protein YgaU
MTSSVRPFLALAVAALCSCETLKQSPAYDDPYVSNYGNDGGYNPYPGLPGTAQTGGGVPAYEPPPAPVEADPYAFNAPSSPPPRSSSASSSSSSSSRTTSKSTASKSTAKKSSGSSYKVVRGDTLYGIARKRGSSVAKIKAANGLKSDLIRPGQVLRIP